jgi:hypothetical protein
MDEEPQKDGSGSVADYLKGALNRNTGKVKTMRIWEGSEPVTFKFGGKDEIPTHDRQAKPLSPMPMAPANPVNTTDNNDYNRPDGIDRSLEEDQYPGE